MNATYIYIKESVARRSHTDVLELVSVYKMYIQAILTAWFLSKKKKPKFSQRVFDTFRHCIFLNIYTCTVYTCRDCIFGSSHNVYKCLHRLAPIYLEEPANTLHTSPCPKICGAILPHCWPMSLE